MKSQMVGVKKFLMKIPHVRLVTIVVANGSMDDLPSMLPSETMAVCVLGYILATTAWVCQKLGGSGEEDIDPFSSGPLLSRFDHVKSTVCNGAFEINTRDIRSVMDS